MDMSKDSERARRLHDEVDQCLSYDLPLHHIRGELEDLVIVGVISSMAPTPAPGRILPCGGITEMLC